MSDEKLRLFAKILTGIAYDQDPHSGYFEESLDDALGEHGMTRDGLDALAKELGFDWRCQSPPPKPVDPETEKLTTELIRKQRAGECYQTGCSARADVDGWCDEHSEQFKRYGTHHCVGSTGPGPR